MSEGLQGIIVALVVGGSAAVVLRRYWPRRGRSGCDACAGCSGGACKPTPRKS